MCPTEADRARLTDVSAAVRRARLLVALLLGVGVLVLVPWVGWWPVVVVAVAAGPLVATDRLLARAQRPERLVAASLALHVTLIVVGVGLSGGVDSPALPWVAIPIVVAAARFRLPVFVTVAALSTGGLVLATVLASASVLIRDPAHLIGVVVLVGALAASQRPLLDSEIRSRREAVLDPLTGLLNRKGLERRFLEVAEQARLGGQPARITAGPPLPLPPLGTSASQRGECSYHRAMRRMGFDSCRRGPHLGWGPGSPAHRSRGCTGRT